MILIVWASPNEDGLTAAAKEQICAGIGAAGAKAERIHLNEYALKSCLACGDGWGLCRAEGRCVQEDRFAELYEKLLSAEGVVIVTPVYWHDLAECLKTLLDRLRRCETGHNHALHGREALLVACAGGSGRGATHCLDTLEDTLGHMGIKAVDRLPVTRFNRGYMLPALAQAGRAFAEHLRTGEEA